MKSRIIKIITLVSMYAQLAELMIKAKISPSEMRFVQDKHQPLLLHPPKSDDWKWATDKRCIHNK